MYREWHVSGVVPRMLPNMRTGHSVRSRCRSVTRPDWHGIARVPLLGQRSLAPGPPLRCPRFSCQYLLWIQHYTPHLIANGIVAYAIVLPWSLWLVPYKLLAPRDSRVPFHGFLQFCALCTALVAFYLLYNIPSTSDFGRLVMIVFVYPVLKELCLIVCRPSAKALMYSRFRSGSSSHEVSMLPAFCIPLLPHVSVISRATPPPLTPSLWLSLPRFLSLPWAMTSHHARDSGGGPGAGGEGRAGAATRCAHSGRQEQRPRVAPVTPKMASQRYEVGNDTPGRTCQRQPKSLGLLLARTVQPPPPPTGTEQRSLV